MPRKNRGDRGRRGPAVGKLPAVGSRRRIATRALVVTAAIALAAVGWWRIGRDDPVKGFAPGRPHGPWNVVLVTADTLGADMLGCYGNQQIATPHLDRLAASGAVYENATTVAPLTLPAHTSIMTGTYPMAHGVRDNVGFYVKPNQMTLAGTLKQAGYATGAFVGAFVLDSRWGLNKGFDRYVDDFICRTSTWSVRIPLATPERRCWDTRSTGSRRPGNPFLRGSNLYDPPRPV